MPCCTVIERPHHKAELRIRFLVLALASMMMIGSYYCYDNPSALHNAIKNRFPDQSDFSLWFNLLYTVYSIPNTVLPFFGGYFVDWFGARWMNVMFSSFITLGQLLFAIGSHIKSFPFMLAGRVVFGFGGESLSVGGSTIIAQWFQGKELAFSLGMNLSVARLGSVFNDVTSPALYNLTGSVPAVLYIGVIICAASTICGLIIVPIDKAAEKKLNTNNTEDNGGTLPDEEQIHFSEVKNFQASFWLLTFSCMVVYGCVIPFNSVAQAIITQKFICHGPCCPNGVTKCAPLTHATTKASFIMGIPYVMSAVLSPFLGGLIDWVGGRAWMSLVSSGSLIGVHLCIGLLNEVDDLYGPLVFQGLAYSVFAAALWPSVPYVVKAHQTGTAYGIMTAIQNCGLALFPVIVGVIHNKTGSYEYVEFFFVSLAAAGFVAAVVLNLVDCRNGNLLNRAHYGFDEEEEGEKGENANAPLLADGDKQ